jgi:hypothetical protein
VELVADSMMGKVPLAVGEPEMTAPVRLRPAGRGLAVKLTAAGLEVMV